MWQTRRLTSSLQWFFSVRIKTFGSHSKFQLKYAFDGATVMRKKGLERKPLKPVRSSTRGRDPFLNFGLWWSFECLYIALLLKGKGSQAIPQAKSREICTYQRSQIVLGMDSKQIPFRLRNQFPQEVFDFVSKVSRSKTEIKNENKSMFT